MSPIVGFDTVIGVWAISFLLTRLNGPFTIIKLWRDFWSKERSTIMHELVNCPYCVGFWVLLVWMGLSVGLTLSGFFVHLGWLYLLTLIANAVWEYTRYTYYMRTGK